MRCKQIAVSADAVFYSDSVCVVRQNDEMSQDIRVLRNGKKAMNLDPIQRMLWSEILERAFVENKKPKLRCRRCMTTTKEPGTIRVVDGSNYDPKA